MENQEQVTVQQHEIIMLYIVHAYRFIWYNELWKIVKNKKKGKNYYAWKKLVSVAAFDIVNFLTH